MRCLTADRSKRRSELIRITPRLRILSALVASPVPVALWQLGAIPFCVANKLGVACAYFLPEAAVPWNLYGLKIAETQSALKPILFFQRRLMALARISLGKLDGISKF
jgi:hypothetical protein